jgi:Ca-activated chloride channel family protein
MEIIGEIQKHPNARVFSFGIGDSVNRFLIEGMAKAGRGDSEIVSLNDKADAAAHRLYEHLRTPLLTDVSIDWNGLPVTDVYPGRLPDLFSGKPLVITGRYTAAASGTIRLRGNQAGEKIVREIPVTLSSEPAQQNILPSFWARRKIDDLMSQDWSGIQGGSMKPELQNGITQLGLDYRLMTQFTSFVAVENRVITKNGQPQRVEVPVEMPDGVDYDHVFGNEQPTGRGQVMGGLTAQPMMPIMRAHKMAVGSGYGLGRSASSQGAVYAPPPPPPPPGKALSVVNEPVGVADVKDKPTGERAVLESKLHPELMKAFDCSQKANAPCHGVQEGRVQIQIFLAGSSPDVIAQLKALGFESTSKTASAKILVGSLPVEKLPAIVKMAAVQFVSPFKP